MFRENRSIRPSIDWATVMMYAAMSLLGWFNIYAAVYDASAGHSIFSLSVNSGKQLLWMGSALLLITAIFVIDYKFYSTFAYPVFGLIMLVLVAVLVLGYEVKGSNSWFKLGFARLQPAEFAKFGMALCAAKFLEDPNKKVDKPLVFLTLLLLLSIPVALVMLQGDTGSALVFAAFLLVFYREGLPSVFMVLGLSLVFLFILTLFLREEYLLYIIAGLLLIGALPVLLSKQAKIKIAAAVSAVLAIGFVMSVDFIVEDVLKPHQRKRIEILIDPDADPTGFGWQVTQSKIAIGSGGTFGKGFLEGTQTKFDFVPDQSTDFIFCTVGEEHGWVGSMVVLGLFTALLIRLLNLAERQKSRFARVYGYCVASVFFFHFFVNIGMTIGVFPVIGIPLPFFSYGGSSFWAFTIFLFIFLKLDAHRMQVLAR